MPTSRALLMLTPAAALVAAALAWHVAGPAGRTRPMAVSADAGDPWGPVFEASRQRLDAKLVIAREVIAGRRTLPEAAALFGELNRLPPAVRYRPDLDVDPTVTIPTSTTAGQLCRQVVFWAREVARVETPGREASVVARLEAEYRAAQDGREAIPLPGPSAPEPVSELLDRARGARRSPGRSSLSGGRKQAAPTWSSTGVIRRHGEDRRDLRDVVAEDPEDPANRGGE